MSRRIPMSGAVVGGGLLLVLGAGAWLGVTAEDQTTDPALERTRRQVRMLDDLYKTAVVLITDKYVHTESDFSAGSAANALFAVMRKKGWHDVRLLDASGQPFLEKNLPRDEFEKAAAKALVGGEAYYEQVVKGDNGTRELRAATPVPVVSEKCTICHDNYKDVPAGKAIGLLSYRLKVE
jgi:hypothetical protein